MVGSKEQGFREYTVQSRHRKYSLQQVEPQIYWQRDKAQREISKSIIYQ